MKQSHSLANNKCHDSKEDSHEHQELNNIAEFKSNLSDEAIKAKEQDRFYVSGVD